LVLVVLLLGGATTGLANLSPEVDFVATVPRGPDVDAYRVLLDRLDGVRFVAVHMPFDADSGYGSLRTNGGFDELVKEQQDLTGYLEASFPAGTFTHTLSVYEAMRQGNYMLTKIATAGNAPPSSYSMPTNPVLYDQVRQRVLDGDGKDVLAADGSSSILLAFFATKDNAEARTLSDQTVDVVRQWERSHQHPATKGSQASGLLVSSAYVDQRNQSDVRTWGIVSTIAVALALLFVVRRPTNILISTLSLAAGTLGTFGVLGLSGAPISFLTVFLAPMVTGVGMDYALHVLHRQDQAIEQGAAPRAGLASALREVGPATAASAATTIAGLLVLLFVPAPLFAQVGALGAIGVGMGFLTSLTLAPALRAILPTRRKAARRDRIGPAMGAWSEWSLRHPGTVAIIMLALIVTAGLTAARHTRLESGSAENEFPGADPVLLLQKRVEKEYGAFQRAYLIVQGPIATANAIRALAGGVENATDLPLFRSATAVSDLIAADAATDQGAIDIVTGSVQPSDNLPTTDDQAKAALDKLYDDPLWRTLAPFVVTRDATLAVIAIQVNPWESQTDLRALDLALHQHAAALADALGPGFTVHAAGAPVNRAAVIEQTPVDVGLASVGVTIVVTGILAITWIRKPRGPMAAVGAAALVLVASLLLVATIPALDALYKLAGTSNSAALNDMFLLAFAVTVGVGVDGFIQVAHRAFETRDVTAAYRDTGRTVFGAWLTTFVAFAPLAGTYFLQTKNLAILVSIGSVYAFALLLLVGPWILRATAGRTSR
jgi:predicted RND superfamily exporter protein